MQSLMKLILPRYATKPKAPVYKNDPWFIRSGVREINENGDVVKISDADVIDPSILLKENIHYFSVPTGDEPLKVDISRMEKGKVPPCPKDLDVYRIIRQNIKVRPIQYVLEDYGQDPVSEEETKRDKIESRQICIDSVVETNVGTYEQLSTSRSPADIIKASTPRKLSNPNTPRSLSSSTTPRSLSASTTPRTPSDIVKAATPRRLSKKFTAQETEVTIDIIGEMNKSNVLNENYKK